MSQHASRPLTDRAAIQHHASEAELRRAMFAALYVTIALWIHRIVTRRHLRALDVRQLADIGRSENDRQRECAKWFWE